MVLNNSWITTTLNGYVRFEKPPLPTWLTACLMKITNNRTDEWLLRFPVAIVSLFLIYWIYKLVKIFLKDENIALLASFVASTTFLIVEVGAENSWDAYSYIFLFGTIAYFVEGLNSEKYTSFFISGFLLACSLLSKGPVALYGMLIPFIISYIYVYKTEKIKMNKKKIFLLILVTLIISSIWPLMMYLDNKDIFLNIMKKEVNTWSNRHTRGFFFYLDFFVFMGSWMIFSIVVFLKKWDFGSKKKNDFFKFSLIWEILVFLFLSFIKMKKQRYGFPIYVVAALPIGVVLDYYLKEKWNFLKKFDKIVFYTQYWIINIACILAIAVFQWKAYKTEFINYWFYIILSLFYLAIIIHLRYSFRNKDRFKKNLIIYTGLILVLINLTLTPIIERDIRKKTKNSYTLLKSMNKVDLKYPVYSKDFDIEEVWMIGKNINKISEETDLPTDFYYLSHEKIDENDFKDYSSTLIGIFSRYQNSNDLTYVYLLKKN